jgi:lysophospholipase L1-like esterase
MKRRRIQTLRWKLALLLGSLVFCLLALEIGYYRLVDPFPFIPWSERNRTTHGNLMMYDATLGWTGVPDGTAPLVTENNRIWLAHNSRGFRDLEHDDRAGEGPAITFLGDSFTWGYEVEFEEMFVNRLRKHLSDHEVFNLAHQGYGTDQELLTFLQWEGRVTPGLVVLMFTENDVADNHFARRYGRRKPKFEIVDDRLVLTGVPVPEDKAWASPPRFSAPAAWKRTSANLLFRSHLLHDVYFRVRLLSQRMRGTVPGEIRRAPGGGGMAPDLVPTSRILEELRDAVERTESTLLVVFVPSKREVEEIGEYLPYQLEIAAVCRRLGVEHFDLAPAFKRTWRRTYYRRGMHWNARGHEVAARALLPYLVREIGRHDSRLAEE